MGIEDLNEDVFADPLVLVGKLKKLRGRAPSHGNRWQRQMFCVVAGEQGVVAERGWQSQDRSDDHFPSKRATHPKKAGRAAEGVFVVSRFAWSLVA